MKQNFANDLKNLDIPTIMVKINEKDFRFLLDSGSSMNYISSKAYNKVAEVAEMVGNTSTYGFEGHKYDQLVFKIPYTLGKEESLGFFGLLATNSLDTLEEENGVSVDGIVGTPFMLLNRIRINYRKQVVEYQMPRKGLLSFWEQLFKKKKYTEENNILQ